MNIFLKYENWTESLSNSSLYYILKYRFLDADTHSSDKRPECKWKKKKKKKEIKREKNRLRRSLLESSCTCPPKKIKNVNNRFGIGIEIFTLTNICAQYMTK